MSQEFVGVPNGNTQHGRPTNVGNAYFLSDSREGAYHGFSSSGEQPHGLQAYSRDFAPNILASGEHPNGLQPTSRGVLQHLPIPHSSPGKVLGHPRLGPPAYPLMVIVCHWAHPIIVGWTPMLKKIGPFPCDQTVPCRVPLALLTEFSQIPRLSKHPRPMRRIGIPNLWPLIIIKAKFRIILPMM